MEKLIPALERRESGWRWGWVWVAVRKVDRCLEAVEGAIERVLW